MLAGKDRLEVTVGQHVEVALQDRDGALKPEFDVGEVKASCLPLMSSTFSMPEPG